MDCKELIEMLRAYRIMTLDRSMIDDALTNAADAIEALMAERDAAMEDLRGLCWCCSHATPWMDAFGDRRLSTCEYIQGQGVLFRGGGKCRCAYWQWRGPQKEPAL